MALVERTQKVLGGLESQISRRRQHLLEQLEGVMGQHGEANAMTHMFNTWKQWNPQDAFQMTFGAMNHDLEALVLMNKKHHQETTQIKPKHVSKFSMSLEEIETQMRNPNTSSDDAIVYVGWSIMSYTSHGVEKWRADHALPMIAITHKECTQQFASATRPIARHVYNICAKDAAPNKQRGVALYNVRTRMLMFYQTSQATSYVGDESIIVQLASPVRHIDLYDAIAFKVVG